MCNRASKSQVKMTELSLCTIAKVFVGEKNQALDDAMGQNVPENMHKKLDP